jgi:sporulation and cell division protein SsgA
VLINGIPLNLRSQERQERALLNALYRLRDARRVIRRGDPSGSYAMKTRRQILKMEECMGQTGEPTTRVMCRVTVTVGLPAEPPVPLPAELGYDMDDPYAVRLSLGVPEIQQVDWVFARSLLEEGMHRPAGVGSVLVSPQRLHLRHFVRIVVRSPTGVARIQVSAAEVRDFLRQSHELMPYGAESRHVDVDRLLTALMGSCD